MTPDSTLDRRLGLFDAVAIGMGAMLGAGVFAAFAPAAATAGSGLLIGLTLAAVVAYCNATSSARLAALYPQSGGTYVYGRERLGRLWGHLAGWAFVVGKTASCAAMALTFANYLTPNLARPIGVAAVVALTIVNYFGAGQSVWLARVAVAITVLALVTVIVACLAGGQADPARLIPFPGVGVPGILQAAGVMFFAFAGYARIATLGEEVRTPSRVIPRAILIALGITFAVYTGVAVSALLAIGPDGLSISAAPLLAAVRAGSLHALSPAVRIGGTVATLGSLLALILGVSRTVFAMARDRHLPRALDAVHPGHRIPHRAELAVGAVVAILVATVDLRGAIGFSSFGVLVYYAITNASALTLSRDEHRPPHWLPILGMIGCLVLAFSLPAASVLIGTAVLAIGLLWFVVRRMMIG